MMLHNVQIMGASWFPLMMLYSNTAICLVYLNLKYLKDSVSHLIKLAEADPYGEARDIFYDVRSSFWDSFETKVWLTVVTKQLHTCATSQYTSPVTAQ